MEIILYRAFIITLLLASWVLREPTAAEIAEAHRLTLDEDARRIMDALNAELSEEEGEVMEAWA